MSSAALLQSMQLEHLPPDHTIHVALFRDVKNASAIHEQLLAGNSSFEYGFIDASVIISKIHVLAAAYRAVNDAVAHRLTTRNVHSEMVFALSPNNNIAESFRRFGITHSTTSLLVLKLSSPTAPAPAASVQTHLSSVIEGEQVAVQDEVLCTMTDLARVRKLYKLNGIGGAVGAALASGTEKRESQALSELEVIVLGAMALRGSTN